MLYIEVCSMWFTLHVSKFNEAIFSFIKFSFSRMGISLIMPMLIALATRLLDCVVIQLKKGKAVRKHSLHEENGSLGFIVAFLQW